MNRIRINYLQRQILSGRAVNLFPETLRILNLSKRPMESGSESKELEDRFNSSRFSKPAIESGIACNHMINVRWIEQFSFLSHS